MRPKLQKANQIMRALIAKNNRIHPTTKAIETVRFNIKWSPSD